MIRPLHEQIASDLRRKIISGELSLGANLPSEGQLCEQWHGSRGPVRQALASLRAEGLIGGGRGRPPVVRRRTAPPSFASFLSFSRWADELGRTAGQHTVELALRPASVAIAEVMGLAEADPVVQLIRLRLLDDEPVMLERTTFSAEVGRSLFSWDCDSGSIYAHLIEQGLQVGVARHTIDAVCADDTDAALLIIDQGAPLLRELRLARTSDGDAFEYSEDRYRPDVVSLTIENHTETAPLLSRSWNPTSRIPATTSL